MTDKNFTNSQSPRASRSSTDSAEKYAKDSGAKQDINPIRKDGGPENSSAWQHQGKSISSQKDV